MVSTVDEAIEAARADASRRTGATPQHIKVVSAGRVTWRDGSLGCPQPGVIYTMSLVQGYRVRLLAGAESMDYHLSLRGALVLCKPGQAAEPAQGTD